MTVPLTNRRYYALLRERDELTYQIGIWQGFIDKRNARLAEIDRQLAEYETKGRDVIVNTSEKTTVSYEALSEVCGAGEK